MEDIDESKSELESQKPIEAQAYPKNILNQKGIWLPIIGVIFVVALIGIGIYFLNTNKTKTQPSINQQQNVVATPTTSLQIKKVEPATDLEAKNWQVYKNKDFTIKYPSDLKLENTTSVFDWFGFKNASLFNIEYTSKNAEDKKFYSVMFAIIKNAPKTTAEELAKKDIQDNSKGRETQVLSSFASYVNGNINGLYYLDPGEKLEGKRFGFNHDIIDKEHAVVIEIKDNNIFIFKIAGNNFGVSEEQFKLADKILSTFTPNQTILVDKPLDELIHFTLPNGWKMEKHSKDEPQIQQSSGTLVIKSNDWDEKNPPNFMQTNRPGLIMTIYKNYEGSVYTQGDKYKTIYDEIHDPNPGGATDHDLTKLTIAGYPAISYFYTFEGYEHTYNIWQDDNIWTISVTSYQEPNYKNQMDNFLSSISFSKEN